MGLDLHINGYESENSKIGSYGGFMGFRVTWAKHLGFDLREMRGFGGKKKWTKEPLQCFFNHSDCDGLLTPNDCKEILKQAETDFPLLMGDLQCAYSFPVLIDFCKEAVERNKDVEFS